MKNIKFLTTVLIVVFGMIACSEYLDIDPKGNLMNEEQLLEGAAISASRTEAPLVGMFAQMTTYDVVYNGGYQSDFGYPALTCWLEHAGDNVVSTTHGYNWFATALQYAARDKSRTGRGHDFSWIHMYKYIKLANDIIATGDPEKPTPAIAQAYAMRAFSYSFLAQTFQFTYVGNENAPCVPIVTEQTKREELTNNPRKTVKEVYDLILSDLDIAIKGLEGYQRPSKSFINQAVAYGLRARAYLVMNQWDKAAADAQKAIEISGAQPFSIEDCSIPNFDDVQEAKNALWGIIITGEDAVTKTGICNWTSMFTSLCFGSGGYTTMVGTYKMINTRLYEQISDTDIRKHWWIAPVLALDNNGKPEVDDKGQPKYILKSPALEKAYPKFAGMLSSELLPYSVVKFAPNNKNPFDEVNAVDFMLMRVEEMYYILAEAKVMGGKVAEGKSVLENFVRSYRDPEYSVSISDAKSLQDEIYLQKRIEFWGEGISWFDMMRLKKGVNRVDAATKDSGGYPELTRFNIAPDDPNLIYQIPLAEEQANKGLEGNNNPMGTQPVDLF